MAQVRIDQFGTRFALLDAVSPGDQIPQAATDHAARRVRNGCQTGRAVADHIPVAIKELKLRRPDRCIQCNAELPTGVVARWDPSSRTVTCLLCTELAAAAEAAVVPRVDSGTTGASIGRKHARRRSKREQRVRGAHPRIGGVLLALSTPPQQEEAFRIGEEGEMAVGVALEKAVAQVDGIVLHNRRMPSGRGDIDHIAIVPSGIYVIDAKAVRGKVKIRRPWSSRRSCSSPAATAPTTSTASIARPRPSSTPSHPPTMARWYRSRARCFTHADLPWLRTVEIRGHLLIYLKALAKRLLSPGPLDHTRTEQVAAAVAHALRPA